MNTAEKRKIAEAATTGDGVFTAHFDPSTVLKLLVVVEAAREWHDFAPGCAECVGDSACSLGEALNDWEAQ